MERDKLVELYKRYDLTENNVFKHKHYTIITRTGVESIANKEGIAVSFDIERTEPHFAVVKATAYKRSNPDVVIETFGSALYGHKEKVEKGDGTFSWLDTGTCTTLYTCEMAEKRAFSRAVLKITGLYSEGVFGEDEAEDFKKRG